MQVTPTPPCASNPHPFTSPSSLLLHLSLSPLFAVFPASSLYCLLSFPVLIFSLCYLHRPPHCRRRLPVVRLDRTPLCRLHNPPLCRRRSAIKVCVHVVL